jgi:hypothetical protein
MPVLLKTRNHMHIRKIWHRLTTTRYARTLEAELALEREVAARLDAVIAQQGIESAKQDVEISRLRAENRALLNSILGIAGVPPLPATEADLTAMNARGQAEARPTEDLLDTPAADSRTAGVSPAPLPLGLHKKEMLEQQQNPNSKTPARRRRYEDHSPAARTANHSRPRANPLPHVAAPTRRRSWPQIHRLLEFESAQKEKPAADPLPPAHH